MRYSIVVLALIASVSAIPSNSFSPRQEDICTAIGSSCDGSEAATCCEGGKPGFASCKKQKIKFTTCKDGCGALAGVIQCVDNPKNWIARVEYLSKEGRISVKWTINHQSALRFQFVWIHPISWWFLGFLTVPPIIYTYVLTLNVDIFPTVHCNPSRYRRISPDILSISS